MPWWEWMIVAVVAALTLIGWYHVGAAVFGWPLPPTYNERKRAA